MVILTFRAESRRALLRFRVSKLHFVTRFGWRRKQAPGVELQIYLARSKGLRRKVTLETRTCIIVIFLEEKTCAKET